MRTGKTLHKTQQKITAPTQRRIVFQVSIPSVRRGEHEERRRERRTSNQANPHPPNRAGVKNYTTSHSLFFCKTHKAQTPRFRL